MNLIHKFESMGRYILIDIYSGAVHIVSKIVYDIVDDVPNLTDRELIEKYPHYPEEEITEAAKEIRALMDRGELFSPEIEAEDIHYNPQHVIKAMCLNVSHDCNLRCTYCFASQGDYDGSREVMDFETGKKALDFLVAHSGNRRNLEVDFFGGEPLMNWEVVKALTLYGEELNRTKNKNLRFTLTTNGLGLNDEVNAFLNEHMKNVVLSVDGRRDVNDRMRPTANGRGSFDLIVPKIKRFIESRGDKEYYIRGTFTANNLDFGEDAKEFHRLGFEKISLEPVVTDPEKSYALRDEHLPQILEEYERFAEDYVEIRKRDKDFLFFHYLIDLDGGPCLAKRSIGCGAGVEYICVTPKGEIYPCHQFVGETDFLIGSLDEGITRRDIVEEFQNANVFTKEECRSCWAKFYCSGGCHANAYYNNGDLKEPYHLGCMMEQKRIECAIGILAQMEE